MVEYFPKIHKDEMLYSLVSRYNRDIKSTNKLETYNDLFSTENMLMSTDFPSRINELVENIGVGGYFTPDNIIYQHTMFPLVYPFLDKERQRFLYREMLNNKSAKEIHMKIGIMGSSVKVNRCLRYCPECIKEDIELYGEAIWHRSHNVPGVYYCHKHEVDLSEVCSKSMEYLCKKDERKLVALSGCIEQGARLTAEIPIMNKLVTQKEKERLIDIAKSVNMLLLGDLYKKDIYSQVVYKVYYYKLEEYNMLDNSGRVKLKQVGQELQKYYGKNILEEIGLAVDLNTQYSWLKSFIGKKGYTVVHPLKHIILINWIYDGHIKQFFTDLNRKLVRKKDLEWPCLNKAAEHYKQHVIKGYKLSYNSKGKYYIATFSCECGFIYTRKLSQLDEIYTKSRVIKFGDVWETQLCNFLKDENLTINEISSRLGTDKTVIIAHGIKLGLIDKNKQRKYKKTKYATKKDIHFERKVEVNIKPNKITKRVDWNIRDEELSGKIITLLQGTQYQNNTRRITKSWIGKQLNCLYYLQKYMDKLPITKSLIDNYIDINI